MKLDLHMHPLCHEYYGDLDRCHGVKELTVTEKGRIQDMIDWCIARGVEVMAVTDHDMIISSLYAIEYIKEQNLPIKAIPGVEIELYTKELGIVHICALGIKELPDYGYDTPIPELVNRIHALGGIAIINHPYYSQMAFFVYYECFDGYEYINNDDDPFDKGKDFLAKNLYSLMPYRNSDYHYNFPYANLPANPKYAPQYINDWQDSFAKEWLKQFK